MARSSISLSSALGQHVWLMLTCRHDGRGLPSKASALVYAVIGSVFALTGAQLDWQDGARSSVLLWGVSGLWLVAVCAFVAVPLKMVEVFVGGLLLQMLKHAAYLVFQGLPGQVVQPLMLPVELWFLFALLSLMRRHSERLKAPTNRAPTNEKQ